MSGPSSSGESDRTVHVSIDGCEIWVEHPVPGILLTRASGAMTLAAAKPLMDGFDEAARLGLVVEAFHDWSAITGYTSDVREAYVRWSLEGRHKARVITILVRSKLVAMGLSVANLKLGYLRSYTDPVVFEDARERAIAKRKAALRLT